MACHAVVSFAPPNPSLPPPVTGWSFNLPFLLIFMNFFFILDRRHRTYSIRLRRDEIVNYAEWVFRFAGKVRDKIMLRTHVRRPEKIIATHPFTAPNPDLSCEFRGFRKYGLELRLLKDFETPAALATRKKFGLPSDSGAPSFLPMIYYRGAVRFSTKRRWTRRRLALISNTFILSFNIFSVAIGSKQVEIFYVYAHVWWVIICPLSTSHKLSE